MLPPRAFADPGRLRVGARDDLPRLDLRRPRLAGGRAGQLPDARDRHRQRRRDGRRGRPPPRLPQRLPAPRREADRATPREASAAGSSAPTTRWSYGLDGELKAAPHMDGVEDFDPSCWGLIPVRVATVGGLVLVDLSGEAPDVDAHVGDLAGHLERYRVGALRRAGQVAYEVAANWKAIAENYSECLHCPGVHPELNALSHYMSGEVMEGAGAWCGGSMTLTRGRLDDGARGRPRAAAPADRRPLRRRPELGPLLRAVPERAGLAASRLRDAAHPVAARGRSHRRGLRVVLRAGDDRRRRLRPLGRDRLLGPGQPRGLARLRADPEGRAQPRLRGRPLLGRGGRRARLRRDGRRALHGGAARRARQVPA